MDHLVIPRARLTAIPTTLVLLAVGCGEGTLRRVPGDDGVVLMPDDPADAGSDGAGPGPVTPPPDPDAPPPPYATVSVGTRCTGAGVGEFLVLSTGPGDCASHAAAFEGADGTSFALVEVPETTPFTATTTLCDGGACAPTALTVALDVAGTSGTWSATIAGTTHSVPFVAQRCDYDAYLPPPVSESPVTDLTLTEVALYQGVEIPLAEGGAAVTTSTPIVAGRDALFRVFVSPAAGFAPREVVVRLDLGDGGPPIEERAYVSGASVRSDLGTTLNVTLPADRVTQGTSWAIGVYDADPTCAGGALTAAGARFPQSGLAPLGAQSMGGTFRVVLVPVRYLADGSGRLPDTSEAQVRVFRDTMMSLYPAADVEVTVRDRPMDWSSSISANGSGWSSMLDGCMAERQRDGAGGDTYYYCLFAPSDSFGNFCGFGCVSGLGPVPSSRDTYSRASIGLGFRGAEGTFVHEVGHSLGRSHAPCGGAAGPDPSYPYPGGGIGSWGYDILTGELKDPSRHTDILGYCDRQWISDYNYGALFSRIKTVNSAFLVAGEPVRYATVVVDVDGTLSWGSEVELPVPPSGEAVDATVATSGGHVAVGAIFSAVSHVDGGLVYVPLPVDGDALSSVTIPAFGTLAR